MGFRVLFRSPMVALVSVVTLGLGIGGTTAVFSVADGVLLNPMNFPESNRLVTVSANFSYDNFRDLQSQSRTLESIGVYRGLSVAVTGLGEPERIRGEYVSASYFDVLRARPALGRLVRPDEAVPGGELTTVLSHGYWERRFESDPSILGQTINFNNLPHTIVGVMPPDFRSYWDNTEAWISPQTMPYGGLSEEGRGMFFPIARLADGAELETAERELDLIIGRLEQAGAYPEVDQEQRANVRTLASSIVRNDTRSLVWILLAAVGLVLLIATANVAGLQLARALRRSREMAIRAALGGGRARLMRQLLVENLTLALLGGIFGIGVAVVILRVLEADSLTPFTRFDIELNALALGVAALLTLGTGTLAGLVPAMRGSAIQPASGLREDNRSGSEGRGSSRFRSGLVIAQMAMTVTLLVGASLLLRTAGAMNGLEQGFDAENVLTGETRLTAEAYLDEGNRRTYLEQVVAREPSHPTANNNLGSLYVAEGRSRDALVHFERAAKWAPDDATILLNLGRAYAAAGNRVEGKPLVERAVALEPHSYVGRLGLARIHLAERDAVGAREQLEACARIKPHLVRKGRIRKEWAELERLEGKRSNPLP